MRMLVKAMLKVMLFPCCLSYHWLVGPNNDKEQSCVISKQGVPDLAASSGVTVGSPVFRFQFGHFTFALRVAVPVVGVIPNSYV